MPLSTLSLRRAAPSSSVLRRRLRLAAVSAALTPPQRTYAAGAASAQAAPHQADAAAAFPAVAASRPSPPTVLDAPPSPVEVHQVIARAVQRGRWSHAVQLLLGALHSRCVPLAETYQLVLLAAVRGGGWQASVELTEQVATSTLSTTALYHTAADLLLSQLGQESHGFSELLAHAVVDELVPLMLADPTRHVSWKPRHRESVLRVLAETNRPELVSALFQRWSSTNDAATTATGTLSVHGGAYVCAQREADLLMSAFAATGDWRSAEALRLRLPAPSDDALVNYVRAFTAALKRGGTTENRQVLVPWEVAVDVAARYRGISALTAATAQLQHVAHHAATPTDVARWWWSAETTVHARLTELRRRSAASLDEGPKLLAQCHVTAEDVAELLSAVVDAGVLASSDDASPYWTQWLNVVLALGQYCPSALVSSAGCADGLTQLLPQPLRRVPQFGSSSTLGAAPMNSDQGVPLWQYVATYMLPDAATTQNCSSSISGDGAARYVLTFAATLHYLLCAQGKTTSSKLLPDVAAQEEISKAIQDACAAATRRLREIQGTRNGPNADQSLQGIVECKNAIAVHLRTVGTCTDVPAFAQCVGIVLGDAAATAAVVDSTVLAYLRPLEQLGSATVLCEVMAAALADAPSSQAAYTLALYTCDGLRGGVTVGTLRPVLRRVESFLRTAPHADALMVLCAQLQWCWGGTLEGLRDLAVPILVAHQQWDVLSRLLVRCPPPLSASEKRAAALCAEGQRVAKLQTLVSTGDVASAAQLWGELQSGEDTMPALPAPLHTSLVSLLVADGRMTEACAVLAVAPVAEAATHAAWPYLGLCVCRHVLRQPALNMTLADVWAAAHLTDGNAVVKRETTMGLAMYAAAVLSFLKRDGDAFDLLHEAAAYVAQYDNNHHHHQQQQSYSSPAQGGSDGADGDDSRFLYVPLVLHKTDAQLTKNLPLYVQCAMPSVLLTALSRADATDAATVLRVLRYTFSLSSHSTEAIHAWADVLSPFHATATKLDAAATAKGTVAAAVPIAFSMACCLLDRAEEQRTAAPLVVLQLVVAVITANAFPPDATAALINGVQRALWVLWESGAGSESSAAAVQSVAARVAEFLAAQDRHTDALAWVNEFQLWTATGDARVAAEPLWQWIQAAHTTALRRTDARAALREHRSNATGRGATLSGTPPVPSLDALLECGAWPEAFSCFLRGVVGPTGSPHPTDLVEFSEVAMAAAELRDFYLSPDVLDRVMRTLAQHAPWRTCMQAWVTLCACLPLLSWSVDAEAVTPALQALLSAMQRQAAEPHAVATVLLWAVAQLDAAPSAVFPLAQCLTSAITMAPAWTRAEGEACAERLRQLRGLLVERRVQVAARAIAEAEAALAVAVASPLPLPLPPSSLCVFDNGSRAEAWLQPGRQALNESEVDALAVLAPLLLLATTPQLEALARRHLGGRFQGYELKALLWLYREELRQRVDAAHESESDDAIVRYLAQNTTLHVYVSQALSMPFAHGISDTDPVAAAWLASEVFDGFVPLHVASRLWAACRRPAAVLARCRWTAVVEAELLSELRRCHGRPPSRLRTAPHLSRRTIAHYWSCFHRVLEPELHFGPLELCCLASYAPALTELRRRHPDSSSGGYASEIRELAGLVQRAHFSPSRVPAEDTLTYLRRPHTPAAIAAVMTVAYKKLQTLHTQLFEKAKAAADDETDATVHALPPRLRRLFATCAAATPSVQNTPACLQQASLAAAAWRLGAPAEEKEGEGEEVAALDPSPTLADVAHQADSSIKERQPRALAEVLCVAQQRLPSLLLRSWVSWVLAECAVPRQPIPPAASLLLVEWTREALHPPPVELTAEDDANSSDVERQWSAQAAAGQRELRQRRCQELSVVWEMLADTDAWSLMNAGHRAALEKTVGPTAAQVKSLPSKTRRDGGECGKVVKSN